MLSSVPLGEYWYQMGLNVSRCSDTLDTRPPLMALRKLDLPELTSPVTTNTVVNSGAPRLR